MNYELNFGKLAETAPTPKVSGRFRLAVLADLSGRATRGEIRTGSELSAQVGRRVDVDNFDQLLSQLELKLRLDLGGTDQVEIAIDSLDDFHPDELFEQLDLFSQLSDLRKRLGDSSTFEIAAAEIRSWAHVEIPKRPQPRSGSDSVPRGKLSDFAQLIGKQTALDSQITSVEDLVRSVVAPHIVPKADSQQEEFISMVDDALSDAMRRVLHHPGFQAAESTWRSIDLLTRRLETDQSLEIVVYDISAEEIAADLSSTSDLTQTGVYQLLVVQPSQDANQGALSAIAANYLFEPTPPHADLLARIAQIGAAAQAPFIAGLSCQGVERYLEKQSALSQQVWNALQGLPQSVYLGLVSPRYLLRWPYGKKTEPIESFSFEEFTPQDGFRGMLWGNGSILVGMLMGQTFVESDSLTEMNLGSLQAVDDLPFYCFTDKHGDVTALPCGERLLSEDAAKQLDKMGCMPVASIKGRPEIRILGFRSVHGPLVAGPWNVVEIPTAPVPRSDSVQSSDAGPSDVGNNTADEEIDVMLDSLDEEDQSRNNDDDDEMDPDLAKLLDEL